MFFKVLLSVLSLMVFISCHSVSAHVIHQGSPPSGVVAFSVARRSHLVAGGSPITIVYDVVHSNAGNGYDATTGQFTAPVAGYYLLMMNMRARGGSTTGYVKMRHNADIVVATYAKFDEDWGGDSNQVILYLEESDVIITELQPNMAIHGDNLNKATTFSGFLLR